MYIAAIAFMIFNFLEFFEVLQYGVFAIGNAGLWAPSSGYEG